MKIKKDLVKQFELTVLQEIKNYNDKVYHVHDSLNSFDKKIEVLADKFKSLTSFCENTAIDVERSLNLMRDNLKEMMADLLNKQSDQSLINERNARNDNEMGNALNIMAQKIGKINENLINSSNSYYDLSSNFNRLKSQLDQDGERLAIQFKRGIDKLREEILSRPSEALQVKKELEKKIHEKNLDIDGFRRELEILKKTCFIQEKKIENLYTLIERLEKRIIS